MLSKDSNKILIVAAEPSSCLYAQRLLEHFHKEGLPVEAFGVGDRAMEALGFDCIGRAEEMAVMGVQEVYSHWDVIKRAFHALIVAVKTRRPDVILLLDYPGFNLRFAKKVKRELGGLKIPIVYYISPQVWAWKSGRVNLIREVVDKMLVLLPFESEFYARHGVRAEFVGHPLLDELRGKFADPTERHRLRARYGFGPDDVLLGLMPGSRRSEIKHHLRLQIETAEALRKKNPELKIALLLAPSFEKSDLEPFLESLNFNLTLIKDEPFAMINLTDLVLCASGTATLMVGLLEKPMVIMYRMNPLTAFLAKRFVRSTPHFGLINLVLGERAAVELFQEQASVARLVAELDPLIRDPGLRREFSLRLRPAKVRLGDAGATARVAAALKPYFSARN